MELLTFCAKVTYCAKAGLVHPEERDSCRRIMMLCLSAVHFPVKMSFSKGPTEL